MQEILTIVFCIVVVLSISLFSLYKFFKVKKKKYILEFLVGVLASMFMGGILTFRIISKSIDKVQSQLNTNKRTGIDIYEAQFGKPICPVNVIGFQDPVVPRIDTELFLCFKTCNQEIERIIKSKAFKQIKADSSYLPQNLSWINDSLKIQPKLVFEIPFDGRTGCKLIINKDTTQAIYINISD